MSKLLTSVSLFFTVLFVVYAIGISTAAFVTWSAPLWYPGDWGMAARVGFATTTTVWSWISIWEYLKDA